MDPLVYDVLVESVRALFLICLPLVAALALAGTVIAALQSATSMQEPALGYGVRLVTFIFVLYFMYPTISQSLLNLANLVYR